MSRPVHPTCDELEVDPKLLARPQTKRIIGDDRDWPLCVVCAQPMDREGFQAAADEAGEE